MKEYLFTFRSLTAATQAVSILRRKGISGVLLRTPAELRANGCGHGVMVYEAVKRNVPKFLGEDAPFQGLFFKGADGLWQKVHL